MEAIKNKKRILFLISLIAIAAICRLLPHPPNFTPIAAMALFGGAMFGNRILALAIPLIAMLVSDLVIGFHGTMWAVYLAFAAIAGIGMLLSGKTKLLPLMGAAVGSSLLFFIVTNFAVLLGSPIYPQNLEGLALCYGAAIAFYSQDLFGSFFLNTLLGDLFYTTMLFGSYYLVSIKFPELSKVNS